MNNLDKDYALAHYGVKGMKWGVRKNYTESRRQYRKRTKQERVQFEMKRADDVVRTALKKKGDVLVRTFLRGNTSPSLLTGTEFITALAAGHAFDTRMTDIYATKNKKQGAFILNETPTARYQKTARR